MALGIEDVRVEDPRRRAGQLVRDATLLREGDGLKISFAKGGARARVEETSATNSTRESPLNAKLR